MFKLECINCGYKDRMSEFHITMLRTAFSIDIRKPVIYTLTVECPTCGVHSHIEQVNGGRAKVAKRSPKP